MLANLIKKFILNFGYDIRKKTNFNDFYKKYLTKNKIVVFDVGAHQGESIIRFQKLFKNPEIHSFEPQLNLFQKLIINHKKKTNFINNFALGDKSKIEKFYYTNETSAASFSQPNKNSKLFKNIMLKNRKKLLSKVDEVRISTLDEYVFLKKIDFIDILKIDVQTYEDNVLKGSLKNIKENKINFIELEISFGDMYEKKLSFYEIESLLYPYGYRLFAINNHGDLYNQRYLQLEAVYKLAV